MGEITQMPVEDAAALLALALTPGIGQHSVRLALETAGRLHLPPSAFLVLPLRRLVAALALALIGTQAGAVEVRFVPVADGVFAHVGDKGARTAENEGLNANIGLVVGGPRLTHRGLPQSDFAFSNPRIPKNAPSMWLLLPMDFCFVGLFTEASYAPTMTSRGFTTETQRT